MKPVFEYEITDGVALETTSARANEIESLDSVETVRPDIPVFLPVMEGDGDKTDRNS